MPSSLDIRSLALESRRPIETWGGGGVSGFERFNENGPQARECVSCPRLIPWKWVPEAEMRRTGCCLVPCRLMSRVSATVILRGLSVSPSMKWESRSRSAQKERGRRFEIRGLPWMPRNWSSDRSLDLLSWWSLEVGAQSGDNLTFAPHPLSFQRFRERFYSWTQRVPSRG